MTMRSALATECCLTKSIQLELEGRAQGGDRVDRWSSHPLDLVGDGYLPGGGVPGTRSALLHIGDKIEN